jgi:serine/threonine protein kinase
VPAASRPGPWPPPDAAGRLLRVADAFSTPGARIGKYRLVRRLAVGGMAEIFLAMTESIEGFEKLVVIKRILPQFSGDPGFRRMFLDEARLAATLEHPNVVNVHDIGEWDGSYFFTMEYVHGQSLGRVMRVSASQGQPVPLEHTLAVMVGTCAGLHHAHDKHGHDGVALGIVHRDVSPPNILITYDGGVKLVDFGIAKASSVTEYTAVGTLKGKIPYMSPEQCRAERLDRRSDIFALGVVLYELTVGRRPFQAEHELGLLNLIASTIAPLPSTVVPGYPPQLERIVMNALAPHPDHRYATARAFQLDLEDFARDYRVPISTAKLAQYMERLFDEDARRWPTNPAIAARDDRGTGTFGESSDGYAGPPGLDLESTLVGNKPPARGLDAIDSVLSRIVATDAAIALDDITEGLGDADPLPAGAPGSAPRDPSFGRGGRGGGRAR